MSDKLKTIPGLDEPYCLVQDKLTRPLIIVSDVHGCLSELEELLEATLDECAFHQIPDLLFVGDLVDRGPQSFELIENLASGQILLPSGYWRPNSINTLIGNHERKIIRKHFKGNEQTGSQSWFNALTNSEKDFFLQFMSDRPTCAYIEETFIAHAAEPHGLVEKLDRVKVVSPNGVQRVSITNKEAIVCYYGHTTGQKDKNGYPERLHVTPSFSGQTNIFGHIYYSPENRCEDEDFVKTYYIDAGGVFGGHLTACALKPGYLDDPEFITMKCPTHYKTEGYLDGNT